MFDLLMHEYSIGFDVIANTWTLEQILLMHTKANKRLNNDFKVQAKLHGVEIKEPGLDISGAIPLESYFQ